jgi:hypothetical protein
MNASGSIQDLGRQGPEFLVYDLEISYNYYHFSLLEISYSYP